MTSLSYIITIVLFYCIVLYSIKWDWLPCKVVFRVGNQNTKCDEQKQSNVFVLLHRVHVCTEHHQYNSTQVVFMEEQLAVLYVHMYLCVLLQQ